MPDVFVSYSRRDSDFVTRLVDGLESRGKSVWIDTEGIGDGEVFPDAIRSAIEQSDGFVFVITPASVGSPYCENEVEYALSLHKRVVPVLRAAVPDPALPEPVRVRNWIPFTDEAEFVASSQRLASALDTDLESVRAHTRWLVKALEWDGEGRDRSFLLRGSELKASEAWLSSVAADGEPAPTALQRDYISASRAVANRWQRAIAGGSLAVAAVSVALLVFALISRNQAISAKSEAQQQAILSKSRALAAESQTQLSVDPERSILLAMDAVRTSPTPEAMFALRRAIDLSPGRWRLPSAGAQDCPRLFSGPGISFSHDGALLAEGLCRGDVVVLSTRSHRVLRRLHTPTAPSAVAFDPAQRLLAVATHRGLLLLDPMTGATRRAVMTTTNFTSVAFSRNGSLVAGSAVVGPPGAPGPIGVPEAVVWNVRSGATRVLKPLDHAQGIFGLSFSPDGRSLAVATDRGVQTFAVATGRVMSVTARGNTVDSVAYSPDGRLLAVTEVAFNPNQAVVPRIVLLDSRRHRLVSTVVRLPAVEPTTVAFSPDGTRLAYGAADGTAGLWSVVTKQPIVSYLGHTAAISQVAFAPDGRTVATASVDGTGRVWSATGVEQQSFLLPRNAFDARLLADRVSAISDDPGRRGSGRIVVHSWSLATGQEARPLVVSRTDKVDAIFFDKTGRLVGVIGAANGPGPSPPIRIWGIAQRRVVRSVSPQTQAPSGGEPRFSPDGTRISMGIPGPTSTMAIVDVTTGGVQNLGTTQCTAGWRDQPFSEDGRLLAAGDFCGGLDIWNARTGHRLGRHLSVAGQISVVAFRPDGRRIAVASWNSSVTVFDVATQRPVAVLTEHTKGVDGVAYSPDGRYLATGSLDDTVRIWDAQTNRLLRILDLPAAAGPLAFSPDGRTIVTTDGRTVRIWDTCSACGDPTALLALAGSRVTRGLTPLERRTFGA